MKKSKKKIGIIGCGNISTTYFSGLKLFDILEIAACADLDRARAQARAEEFQIPKASSVSDLLANPEIEIVVNLTIPKAHGEVGLAALEAGKNVYNEKPLTVTRDEAKRMLKLAETKKLRIGSAPDTFLGGGLQTCRKLIDDGWIGQPVGATAFMMCGGHESWHPDPAFYYQPGGGPMFDMGPYYLTALVMLLGPVKRVTGSTRITHAQRLITSQPKYGTTIHVKTPTHIVGTLDFESGVIGNIITSFDVSAAELPHIEIYGSHGTLSVPDPNCFEGPVRLLRSDKKYEMPLTHGYATQYRGLGVADMAYAITSGRAHRANGNLAYHVLDIMHAIEDSSCEGKHIILTSTCTQPAPLPMNLLPNTLD